MKLPNIFKKNRVPAENKPKEENPYLTARRSWNEHVGGVVSSRQTWQVIGILSMLIALASVGGVIHLGNQSKFVPYVVKVDKLGQSVAVGRADKAAPNDPNVIHAQVASFISDIRLVTPDVALQRKAVFRVYSMLAPGKAATAKTNDWLNGTANSSPFKRAEKETVSVEIITVIPQTENTWQVDWKENKNDRDGSKKPTEIWRALVTVYTVAPTPQTTEEEFRNNPARVFVEDYSWSRLQTLELRKAK